MPGNKAPYSNSLNHFRAISIILIVSGHSYGTANIKFDSTLISIISNLITGGTSLFVFISGFMFHHVFYNRFNYAQFCFGKIKNVFIPYIVLGTIPVIYAVTIAHENTEFGGYFLPQGDGIINEYFFPAGKYFITGRFETAYWYVPFIMVTFLISPLHYYFIKISLRIKLAIIFVSFLKSVFIHRPELNLPVIQNVIYFNTIYLIGITASIYKSNIYSFFKGKESFLFILMILLSYLEYRTGHRGNYQGDPLSFKGIDLMLMQKIVMCFFFMIILDRYEKVENKYIGLVAKTSFAVFFIHPFIIRLANNTNGGKF